MLHHNASGLEIWLPDQIRPDSCGENNAGEGLGRQPLRGMGEGYIYIYVCIIYEYIYIYIYIHMCIYKYACVYECVCMHVCMSV